MEKKTKYYTYFSIEFGKINFQVNNSDIETKGLAPFRFKYLIFEPLAMALSEETTYL